MRKAGKVLFTASTFSHIRHFHLPYLRRMGELGWTVHVACGGAPAEVPGAERVIDLPLQKRMAAAGNFRAAAILRREIKKERYDLISAHTSLAAFFTRLAVKGIKDRPQVVDTVHGYLFDDDTPALRRALLLGAERLTAPETDLLLVMNQWDLEAARRYRLGKRVELIPGMGVDFAPLDAVGPADGRQLREELGMDDEAFVLVYPAEFSERKSQAVLLRAMAQLPENVTLVLPGSGALLGECKALAASLGVARRAIFPGEVEDMAPWYAMADAAVTASRSEGLPFNVMEALHCGLPVAASRVKGHTDLVRPGANGFLYPYGDSGACAAAVRELMALSPAEREAMAAAARASVAPYALEKVLPASPVVNWKR